MKLKLARRGWVPASLLVTLLLTAGIILLTKGASAPHVVPVAEVVTCIPPGEPLPAFPPVRDYVNFINAELDSTHTVGAAYVIVQNGQVLYTGTHGVRRKGSHEPVDEHTLFRLASVSKGFAGALACLLEQEGMLSLDDRVSEYYPGFALKDSVNTTDLTLRHLLSHTSGLVPYAFDNLVEADEELDDIADRLVEVDISAPPGELYGYQNVMFSLMDPILQRITGLTYPELLDQKIFDPLEMDYASAGSADWDRSRNIAHPHVRGREGYIAIAPHHGYYNVLPAAGVNASIRDMGKWLQALMGSSPEQFPDPVRTKLSTPVIYTPLKSRYTRYWQRFRERYYSLGWRIYQYRGLNIVYHGGYIRGYRAEIGFCPEEQIGFAFMQNSPNGLASRVTPEFFDRIVDYREAEKAMQEALLQLPDKMHDLFFCFCQFLHATNI